MVELTAEKRAAYEAQLEALLERRAARVLDGTEVSVSRNNLAGGRSMTLAHESIAALEAEINRLQRLLGLPVEDFSPGLRPFVPDVY